MFEDLILQLQPKPEFNLQWYKGEDLYSDGDIEDVIINIIANNEPEDYTQAIADNYGWATFYHLTHIRKNILNWYPFEADSKVLEIGCGFGAITGELCDRCGSVTAVELSKRRATGALLRCREKDNLKIIVGNLNDIEFEEKFDYITLIGVLEYQGKYTDTDNPYLDFLRKIKTLLKPEGKLLIAIENQYGMKYWCGALEDHTGIPFDGMNQYKLSNKGVRTFSKKGLEELVQESGLQNVYFYYPMPDYKLPTVVYSDRQLPRDANMMNLEYYYIPGTKTMVANESEVYADVIKNGVFDFFANSFLAECTNSDTYGKVTFASLSCKRLPEYRIGTKFVGEETVVKYPLRKEQPGNHIAQILKNEADMEAAGLSVIKSTLTEDGLVTPMITAPTVEEVILELVKQGDKQSILELLDDIYAQILKSSPEADWSENILYTFGLGITPDKNKYGTILKTGFIDMIARNAFMQEGQIQWFDQEWILENVPAGYVMYRLIIQLYHSYYEECNKVLPLVEVVAKYGLTPVWQEYRQLEDLFVDVVIDRLYFQEAAGFAGDCTKDKVNTIKRVMQI